jgi:hypothetical protein
VSELLSTIGDLTGETFENARSMISEASTAIFNATSMLRSYAVDKLDAFQGKWLTGTTEGEPAKAQTSMNYAYYVSALRWKHLGSMTADQANSRLGFNVVCCNAS